jgi:hypothetical protein
MNLVKLQDDLKMLPMAVLQSKAQGQDPQVPPWLATSVLNERMDAQKKAGLAQGAQGEQPSIAEQLNQKAGLMALQGQQQQQAQQQMMSQMAQAPQPTPEGVPQPEQQPQPQMMAQGGLARLPVDSRMFDYREGGIIGFQSRGEVPPVSASKERLPGESFADFRRRMFQLELQTEQAKNAAEEPAREAERQKRLAARGEENTIPPSPLFERKPLVLGTERPSPQATGSVFTPGSQSGLRPEQAPQAGLPSALPKPPTAPAAPRPRVAPPAPPPSGAAPPTGIQTALPQAPPAQSELEKLQMEALRNEPKAQTMDEARAERKAAGSELLNQPAGLAQLARLKQQQEQYEEGKKSRPMENWMRGLASAARGGIGGFGTAYLETAEGNRAADAAQSSYQDKVMTAVEAAQRGEATAEQKDLLASVQGSRTAQSEAARNRLTALGTARNTEAQTQTAGLDRASREKIAAAGDVTSLKIANIQAAATKLAAEGRLGSGEAKQTLAAARAQMDSVQKEIAELSKNAFIKANADRIKELRPQLDTLRKSIAALEGGGTMPPSPGAAPAAPALKYNPATGKIE